MSTALKLRSVLGWLLLISLLAFHLYRGISIFLQEPGFTSFGQVDFNVYYAAAVLLTRGENIYDGSATATVVEGYGLAYLKGSNYIYPPLLAILLVPLGALPPLVAGLVWYLFSLANSVLAVLLILKALERLLGRPTVSRQWSLVLALGFAPLGHSLYVGQVNGLLLLLLSAALLRWAEKEDLQTGLWIGFAASIKVVPLIMLVPLAIIGRLRAVVASLTLVAGTIGLSFAITRDDLVFFLHSVSLRLKDPEPHLVNQSLFGFWSRALVENSFTAPLISAGNGAVWVATVISSSVLIIWVSAELWAKRETLATSHHGLAMAIPATLIPILSPLAWESLFLLLLLPGLHLGAQWQDLRNAERWILVTALFLVQAQRLWDPFTNTAAEPAYLRNAWPLMSLGLYGALMLLWLEVRAVRALE